MIWINFAYFIPLFPLAAFFLIVFITRRFQQKQISALVSILFNTFSFMLSAGLLTALIRQMRSDSFLHQFEWSFPWITLPSMGSLPPVHFEIGVLVDPLSSILAVMVSFVSTLIMIYSVSYMEGDPGFSRFFSFVSLFVFAMLTLVLSNNLLLTFVAWELVGLCSYLLIGFWSHKPSAASAAVKAFVVTRAGDFGFLIGMIALYWAAGTLNFVELQQKNFALLLSGWMSWGIPLLIFCGAVGKSAQFPLHVWLPDAMEGPTPVSALIHAATMVAAGVYLVARTYFLFASSPTALLVVAWIGAFTAFLAATMALVQWDSKRSLAYSTISQLGYMMLGLGVGPIGFIAAVFHLLTHAFFKALLFLGAGSVSHPFHEKENPFDMHHYGGLAAKMPATYWTFLLAVLAITGAPFFAGFFSKDEILGAAFHSSIATHFLLWGIAVFTAYLTSVYMFRLLFLTFHGPKEGDPHAHESPMLMVLPLSILALFALAGGWIGIPGHNWIGHFLGPVAGQYMASEPHGVDLFGMSVGTGVFLSGFYTAWLFYGRGLRYALLMEVSGVKALHTFFVRKWYLDDFWNFILRTFATRLSAVASWIDANLVDGVVHGIGAGIGWLGQKLRAIQTGLVQQYSFVIFCSVLILIFILAHGGGRIWMWLP